MASATTTSHKNGLTTRHHIALDHDLIIVVENYEISKDSKTRKTVLCVHEFKVTSAVLREHGSFRLPSSDGKRELKMRERDPEALKVLLQMLHGCIDQASPNVSILTIWNVLEILRKHSVDPACPEMKGWYAAWYAKHGSINDAQCYELLTPSYWFDHAEAFSHITLLLAINATRHIEERMPRGFNPGHLKLPLPNIRIIGSYKLDMPTLLVSLTIQLGARNGARGSLRSMLHSHLYEPVPNLMRQATCKYKKFVLWAYLAALDKTETWPLEIEGSRKSVNDLTGLLHEFEYDNFDDPHPDDEPCTDALNCGVDFKLVVIKAINSVRDHFHGLCLGKTTLIALGNTLTDRDHQTA